jgi:hypothetical protein
MSDPPAIILGINKKKGVHMNSLNTKCIEHKPMKSAISEVGDEQFTFCMECEQNISRYYGDSDPERLPMWTDWYLTR